jgi:glycosyltransferase involved in cell wall biosynthesis
VKPVLVVTNLVPPDRAGAFRALHEREPLELALFGGRSHHATAGVEDPGVPHRHVAQREVHALAASGRYRAVVCGTAGRTALPAAYAGARRARVPFVLWTALWDHPRTPAFRVAGSPLLHLLYREADALAVYGSHVADFVRRHGARRVAIAPQAVDGTFWSAADTSARNDKPFTALTVGRPAPYKGLDVLTAAWAQAALPAPARRLAVGDPPVTPEEVRNFLAAAHVLVMPARRTPEFLEPWGLVANEAMHTALPVLATDAVGAAAGGLVRHERNDLVVPAGDAPALAAALRRLHDDAPLRERLGAAAKRDVAPFTFDAWAAGMAAALRLAAGRRAAR